MNPLGKLSSCVDETYQAIRVESSNAAETCADSQFGYSSLLTFRQNMAPWLLAVLVSAASIANMVAKIGRAADNAQRAHEHPFPLRARKTN